MRRGLFGFALAGLLAIGLAAAQQPRGAPSVSQAGADGAGNHRDGNHSEKLEKRFTYMTRRYKLTADQQSQLKSILVKEQQDMQTVQSDTFMSRRNKRGEIAELHEASRKKIASILNMQQRHAFDADEKRRAWMDGRLPESNPGPPLNF